MIDFSLLHPTARPYKWQPVYAAWLDAAHHPERVEYVHVPEWDPVEVMKGFGRFIAERNWGRPCLVDAFNRAAAISTGRVLGVVADDFFPCPGWDDFLMHALDGKLSREVAVWASTGGANDANFIVHPILTRAYYQRYRFLFWHEYEAWYADNEFSDVALRDGVILDCRKTLKFEHRHPDLTGDGDAINKRQTARGQAIFKSLYERRKGQGFPGHGGLDHAKSH